MSESTFLRTIKVFDVDFALLNRSSWERRKVADQLAQPVLPWSNGSERSSTRYYRCTTVNHA